MFVITEMKILPSCRILFLERLREKKKKSHKKIFIQESYNLKYKNKPKIAWFEQKQLVC